MPIAPSGVDDRLLTPRMIVAMDFATDEAARESNVPAPRQGAPPGSHGMIAVGPDPRAVAGGRTRHAGETA